jgi:hypothetical protein
MQRGEFKYLVGPPTLWNATRPPDEQVHEYNPFVPGPVKTCTCCEGAGKVRKDVLEEKRGGGGLFDDGLPSTGQSLQGDGTGVLKIDS